MAGLSNLADGGVEVEIETHDIGDITDTNEAPKAKPQAKRTADDPGDGGRRADSGARELASQVERLTKDRDAQRTRADTEARERAAAEGRARQETDRATKATADAAAAKTEGVETQRVAIDNAIAANKTSMVSAEASLAAAWEAGQFKEAAAIQTRIATTAAEIANLEAGKAALPVAEAATTGRVERKDDPQLETKRAPVTDDEKFEAYVSGFSPRAQSWLRDHRDAVTDPQTNHRLIAAHHDALAEGHKMESDDYFNHIEQKLGYADDGNEPEPQPRAQERKPVPRQQPAARPRAAAPVSRENGNGSGGGRQRVQLTAGEKANATDGTLVWNYDDANGRFKAGDPIGIDEMARRKLAMAERYKTTDA